jgi:dual specificity MAP kinase phosphatase
MNGFYTMASSAGRRGMKSKRADCDSIDSMSPSADAETISAEQLVRWLESTSPDHRMCENVLIVDTRGLAQFNAGHVRDCVHVCGNKLVKRRLMQGKINVEELLGERSSLGNIAVLYGDEEDEFTELLATKMRPLFEETYRLTGGFTSFLALAPSFCVGNNQQSCLPLVGCLHSNSCDIMGTTVTEVLPFLYLGCHKDAKDWDIIQSHNIKYVMNVTDKCESRFEEHVKFLRLPVRDAGDENILIYFDRAIAFIEEARCLGSGVLVHCFAGISRSATIAIAYIMKHKKWSLNESYKSVLTLDRKSSNKCSLCFYYNRFVKSKRPNISPNLNFMGQLLDFEKTLHSSKMAAHPKACKTNNCDQAIGHFSRHRPSSVSCEHEHSGCSCGVDSQVGSGGVVSFAS